MYPLDIVKNVFHILQIMQGNMQVYTCKET